MDEERSRAAIHDVAGTGGDLDNLIRIAGWSVSEAQRLLTVVLADYVTEFNRVLVTGSPTPYGVDVSTFLRQYDALWNAKLALG